MATDDDQRLLMCTYKHCTRPRDPSFGTYCIEHGPSKALQILTGAPSTPRLGGDKYTRDPESERKALFNEDSPARKVVIASPRKVQSRSRARSAKGRRGDKFQARKRAQSAHRRRRSRGRKGRDEDVPDVFRRLTASNKPRADKTTPTRKHSRAASTSAAEQLEVFKRLSDASSYTGTQKKKLEEKKKVARQARRGSTSGKQTPLPAVVARLTDQSNYTGVMKRQLEEQASQQAKANAKPTRRKGSTGNDVFARLTSSASMTGISKRIHEDRKVVREQKTAKDFQLMEITPAALARLVDDFVSVVTSAEVSNTLLPTVTRLQNCPNSGKGKAWKSIIVEMIDRHLAACRRVKAGLAQSVCLTASTSPSSREIVARLSKVPGAGGLSRAIGEAMRLSVLGEKLLGPPNKVGRRPMNAQALVAHVFGSSPDPAVTDKKLPCIYMLTIGGKKYVERAGKDRSPAMRLIAHVRAAFFGGSDMISRYELSHALRVTPVEAWIGTVLETPPADTTDADLTMMEQVQIFEQQSDFPRGLNAVVNEHLKRLVASRAATSSAAAGAPDAASKDYADKMVELEKARQQVLDLQAQVAVLKEQSFNEPDDERSVMESIMEYDEEVFNPQG